MVEYQTPSPSLLRKGEFLDFSPFLHYTAKKVIQKLDFSNFDEKKGNKVGNNNGSVIVCFKSPTFNFLNKKYEMEEDFIFSNQAKNNAERQDNISDAGDDEIIKLISKGPVQKDPTPITNNKHESYLKTMNKYKENPDYENNIPTIKKVPPFNSGTPLNTNEAKRIDEEAHAKNLNIHAFYSTPKASQDHSYSLMKTNNETNQPNFTINKIKTWKNDTKNEEVSVNELIMPDSQESFPLMKKIVCNCKKSRCLKLYCDCFAVGEYCSKDCNCLSCANVVDNEDERYSSMMALMERNPLAFKPKYDKKEEIDEKVNFNCFYNSFFTYRV